MRAVIEPRSPSATGRSGWGSSNRGRTPLVHTETANSESPDAEAVAADDLEETAEDAAGVVADDDIVLETEGDDADASSLVEHEDDERKDA